MKKKLILVAFFILISLGSLFAIDYYDTGAQTFMINIGMEYPLSNSYQDKGAWKHTFGPGESGTHFGMGGYGSIDYEVFNSSKTSVGGEIGYQFNYCLDGKIFTQVPMLMKFSYVPVQGQFEIPLSFGLGFNYLSYNNNSKFCLMATATAGARFFVSENWGFGLQSGIQLTPELYLTEPEKNGIATFVPIQLSATYRH